MDTKSIVDQFGFPMVATKADVEARQSQYSKSQGNAHIIPMLPQGRNPVMDDDIFGGELQGASPEELRRLASSFRGAYNDGEGEIIASSSGGGVQVPSVMYNDRFSKNVPISELNIPRDVSGVMQLSMRYAEDNYMVSTGVRIKKNFALKDMTIAGTSTAKTFYQSEYDRLHIRKILNNIFRYYWICGRVVVYWGEDTPIRSVVILDPRLIRVITILGEPMVLLRPDPRWRNILQNPGASPEAVFLKRRLPAWWIPYIMADHEIPLDPKTYALIENDLSLFSTRGIHAMGGTPLSAAFVELSIHRMLLAGDFSVAWMMKNMIALVSIGDPKTEANFQRADDPTLAKLETAFQRPDYAMWAYVDPTVMIRYITPDPDLLKGDRYRECSSHIERVLSIPSVFSQGAGKDGDFSTGSLELKAFREEIQFGRDDIIAQFFGKFNPALREGHTNRMAGKQNPTINFDNNCLVDDRVLWEMNTGTFDRGGCSIQSLLENKVQDIDTERARKKAEQEEVKSKLWTPSWDISHGYVGMLGPDKPTPTSTNSGPGGRPNTTGKPTAEKTTGSQQPRASRS